MLSLITVAMGTVFLHSSRILRQELKLPNNANIRIDLYVEAVEVDYISNSKQCSVHITVSSVKSEILQIFVFCIIAYRQQVVHKSNAKYMCLYMHYIIIHSDTFSHIYVYIVCMWILHIQFVWGWRESYRFMKLSQNKKIAKKG